MRACSQHRARLALSFLTAFVLPSPLLHADVKATASEVTAVSGPSLLERLKLHLEETAMGHTTLYGPPPPSRQSTLTSPSSAFPELEPLGESLDLTGADIYRLSCQSCHQADGEGVVPEINSLIDPIRATSAKLTIERMKARGMSMDRSFAEELAAQAEQALIGRLENGGERMPPFAYLSRRERDALEASLSRLANVSGADHREKKVSESPSRVGELLVKGTCHICHDATGSWPSPQALLHGAIPSLSSLVERDPAYRFIEKVRSGAPVTMGELQLPYRGRMPVFHYLKDQDVFAAYLYLLTYPPKP